MPNFSSVFFRLLLHTPFKLKPNFKNESRNQHEIFFTFSLPADNQHKTALNWSSIYTYTYVEPSHNMYRMLYSGSTYIFLNNYLWCKSNLWEIYFLRIELHFNLVIYDEILIVTYFGAYFYVWVRRRNIYIRSERSYIIWRKKVTYAETTWMLISKTVLNCFYIALGASALSLKSKYSISIYYRKQSLLCKTARKIPCLTQNR